MAQEPHILKNGDINAIIESKFKNNNIMILYGTEQYFSKDAQPLA